MLRWQLKQLLLMLFHCVTLNHRAGAGGVDLQLVADSLQDN